MSQSFTRPFAPPIATFQQIQLSCPVVAAAAISALLLTAGGTTPGCHRFHDEDTLQIYSKVPKAHNHSLELGNIRTEI